MILEHVARTGMFGDWQRDTVDQPLPNEFKVKDDGRRYTLACEGWDRADNPTTRAPTVLVPSKP